MKDYTLSHRNALLKVQNALYVRRTMAGKMVLFTKANQDKLDQARELISQAINILSDVR